MKSKFRIRRTKFLRRARYAKNKSNSMSSVSRETANASDNTANLRKNFFENSLDTAQRNEYFIQKCHFLNILRKNDVLCDVNLICKDDVVVKAHKVVLSGVSQFFYTKFTKYDGDRVLLRDFDSSMLESLVSYAYTNHITIDEDNVEALFEAADFLHMEILREVCEDFFSSTITLENCLHIRSIAGRFNVESLLNTCDKFIMKHFTKVIKDEEFLDLPVDGLLKIIRDDDLNVPSEIPVYTAVIEWIKHDLEKRQKYLCKLMRDVRLAFLGSVRLSRIFSSEPLFANISDITRMQEVQRLFFDGFEAGNSLSGSSLAILDDFSPFPRRSYLSIPKMFVIGGVCRFESLKTVDCYDIRGTMWCPVAHLREGIFGAQAVSTRNKIYVTGSNEVQIYDIKRDEWKQNFHMPTYRRHHASVLLNDKIYVIGGKSNENVPLASVEYYCLNENKWFPAPDMMKARMLASAAALNGKIYVAGGSVSFEDQEYFDSVEYYDPATSTWNHCKPMNYGRSGAAACVVDNLLYVIGGKASDRHGDCFEKYDPVTDTWEVMRDLPVPRAYHGVCYENGYLFVLGGEWGNTYTPTIDVFCFVTGKWYEMGMHLDVERSHAAVVMAYENPE